MLIDQNLGDCKKLRLVARDEQIFESENYFGIRPTIVEQVESRRKKEKEAEKYFKHLPFYVKLIKSFPFVKGVAISGSLSKGVMYEDGDIDYFIITAKDRLWICRTLLILFKKIFLLNSRKYFCVNYFVDEDNLQIPDKNIFTAVEISFLLPIYNAALVQQLKVENNWIKEYFPTFQSPIEVKCYEGGSTLKSIGEQLINFLFPDRLDLFLMKLTYKRWSKKFKHFKPEKLELTMRSNRGVSKHHPKDFQNNVLKAYQERLDKFKIEDESSVLS
jgi:hypothetical protein